MDTLIVGRLERIWKIFDGFGYDVIMGASNDCPFNGYITSKNSRKLQLFILFIVVYCTFKMWIYR